MPYISLTRGFVATVDDEDYEALTRYKWHAFKNRLRQYAVRKERDETGESRIVMMHNTIMGAAPEGMTVDHIVTANTLDNRRSNLRFATPAQQMWNTSGNRRNSTGFHGVSRYQDPRCKPKVTFKAQISVNNKKIFLGHFDTAEEASEAYHRAVLEYRGADWKVPK